MIKSFLQKTGFLIVIMTAGAIPLSYGATVNLKMGGTGSDLGTMHLLAGAYHKHVPGTVIEIQSSIGSTGGIRGGSGCT